MKRFISLFLTACMLLGALCYTVPANAVTHGYTRGDVDDSGVINMKDNLLLKRYIANSSIYKLLNTTAADITADGKVTSQDALSLKKILVGIATPEGNNTDKKYKVDTVTVGNRNINRYTIVVSDKNNECMKYSAIVLKDYIKKACGITLNISYSESSVNTYKIKYVFDTSDMYSLGKEGYRVCVEDSGDVIIYCGSLRGPMYATYFLLEEFIGYRFLFGKKLDNSNLDPYLYEANRVDLPIGYDETEVPILSYRAASQGGCTSFNFPMMRTNAVDGAGSNSCGQAKYGGGVGTAVWHGHSYMYQVDGITAQTQPCLSEESTFEQVLAECAGQVEWRTASGQVIGVNFTQLSASPNDNTNFCKCKDCSAVYASEGSIAGTVFRLSNRVAEKLEEMYGNGLEVFTIAYWDARNPPKYTRPRENVCVCFCIGGCNNHPYDQTELCSECGGNPRLSSVDFNGNEQPQSNALDISYYERWTELTDNIYIWYYSANFIYYISPAPNLFNIYDDFRYLAATGTEGIYSEGSTNPYYSFEHLRGYLASKMMWDPFMSEEAFNEYLNEYLFIYYGPGWESIRTFIEMTDEASDLNGCWTNNFDRPWNMYNEEYFLENYHTLRGLLDEARKATADSAQKERIRLLYFHCDFLGLSATYERDYVNGDNESKAYYRMYYQNLYDMITEYNSNSDSSLHLRLTTYGTDLAYGENFPSSKDDIRSPMTWIFDDFTGYWEWNGVSWQ